MNNCAKTLVIGCGRIGAGTGSREHRSSSHAGVLSENSAFNLWVFDNNPEVAGDAASILDVAVAEDVLSTDLSDFDLAVLCTPTFAHSQYLTHLLSSGVPLVVCEKPVCNGYDELDAITAAYAEGTSRVLVNYIRCFQPAFIDLQARLSVLMGSQKLRACTIRYQRGFLNNASHAISLLQFLLGWNIEDASLTVTNSVLDEFPDDPTISGTGSWNDALLSFVGLPFVRFSLFEIDLYFEREAIRVRDRGDTIDIAVSPDPDDYYGPLQTAHSQTGCLAQPMVNLYHFVESMIADQTIKDNFSESIALTQWMLRVREAA